MISEGGPQGGARSEKIQPSGLGGGPNISYKQKSKSKSRKAEFSSPATPNAQSAVADMAASHLRGYAEVCTKGSGGQNAEGDRRESEWPVGGSQSEARSGEQVPLSDVHNTS